MKPDFKSPKKTNMINTKRNLALHTKTRSQKQNY